MSDVTTTAITLFNTVRHLKPYQVTGRLTYPIRKSIAKAKARRRPISGSSSSRQLATGNPDTGDRKSAVKVLNQELDLTDNVDWIQKDRSDLFRFNVHYHGFLQELSDGQVHSIVHDWIEKNPIGVEPAWHPYPTSLRIINWIKRGIVEPQIERSLYTQAEFLYNFVETHLGGNHLLENARALLYAASFFDGDQRARKWHDRAISIWSSEIKEQILPDGGHYERSTMYHAVVLEGLLDAIELSRINDPEFNTAASLMLDYLSALTHPDGKIALLNDAVHDVAPLTMELSQRAENLFNYQPVNRTSFPDSGYFVHSDESVYLCIDGGPIGPDHLPAHAHGDIFSFELSVGGSRFIVDSGVYEYQEGEMRTYARSTSSHNTVAIDGVDQAEFWSSFRVGKRERPRNISFISNADGFEFAGVFGGYARMIGDDLSHRRTISYSAPEAKIHVVDVVTGGGNHEVVARIHLHPDVHVESDSAGFVLTVNDVSAHVSCVVGDLAVESAWYCPEFGIRLANSVLVCRVPLDSRAEISMTIQLKAAE